MFDELTAPPYVFKKGLRVIDKKPLFRAVNLSRQPLPMQGLLCIWGAYQEAKITTTAQTRGQIHESFLDYDNLAETFGTYEHRKKRKKLVFTDAF